MNNIFSKIFKRKKMISITIKNTNDYLRKRDDYLRKKNDMFGFPEPIRYKDANKSLKEIYDFPIIKYFKNKKEIKRFFINTDKIILNN